MRIALIQFNASPDKADNVRRAAGWVEKALKGGAQFVLLPEIFNWRGLTRDPQQLAAAAENIPGPSLKPLMALAKQYKAHILAGSIIERSAQKNKYYNTSILISPAGHIKAKYRKINLFDARIGDKILRESDIFCPGSRKVLANIGDMTAGLSICYDLRFPAMYWDYGRKGAKCLLVPACFTQKTGQAHWESLLRSRAIENLAYVLAPAQVGADARGIQAYGNSMVVGPWGEVIARGSDNKEEIIYASLDTTKIDEARKVLPGIIK